MSSTHAPSVGGEAAPSAVQGRRGPQPNDWDELAYREQESVQPPPCDHDVVDRICHRCTAYLGQEDA